MKKASHFSATVCATGAASALIFRQRELDGALLEVTQAVVRHARLLLRGQAAVVRMQRNQPAFRCRARAPGRSPRAASRAHLMTRDAVHLDERLLPCSNARRSHLQAPRAPGHSSGSRLICKYAATSAASCSVICVAGIRPSLTRLSGSSRNATSALRVVAVRQQTSAPTAGPAAPPPHPAALRRAGSPRSSRAHDRPRSRRCDKVCVPASDIALRDTSHRLLQRAEILA